MNNIKSKIIMLGLVGVMLTACTDSFLDTSSKTTLNSTSFYKTQAQADYAVVGLLSSRLLKPCRTTVSAVADPMTDPTDSWIALM